MQTHPQTHPTPSMYVIFTYIWLIFMVNLWTFGSWTRPKNSPSRQPKQLIGDVPSQRSKETSFLNHGVEEAKIETQTLVSTKGEDTVDGFRLDVFFVKNQHPERNNGFYSDGWKFHIIATLYKRDDELCKPKHIDGFSKIFKNWMQSGSCHLCSW